MRYVVTGPDLTGLDPVQYVITGLDLTGLDPVMIHLLLRKMLLAKMGTRVKPAYDGGSGEALCARLYAGRGTGGSGLRLPMASLPGSRPATIHHSSNRAGTAEQGTQICRLST
jgi:hypothetical protein